MPRTLVERPRVRTDLLEHYERIYADQPAAADRFLDTYDDLCQSLLRHPFTGHRFETQIPSLVDLRVTHAKKFPNHTVFYRVTADTVEIVRVIHGARDLERELTE